MTRERLYLFDTTLRDGAQTNGVDFALADGLGGLAVGSASLADNRPIDMQGPRHRHGHVMKRPDTPFPRHWLYYLVLKIVVIACAVYFALRIFGVIA